MSPPYLLIGVALLVDGLAGLVGGLLSERWLARHQAALVGFAAGTMLAAVFLDVLPESTEGLGRPAFMLAFASFVSLAILEWFLGHHHHHHDEGCTEHRGPARTVAPAILVSDALHNIGDGASVAAAFLVSPRAGLAVAVAVIAHEVPQEVGDYTLLRQSGISRTRALLGLSLVQLTAFVGAAVVVLAAGLVEQLTAITLALAAGSFLYVGATDLLPELHSGKTTADRRERVAGFLCGIMAIVATLLLH